MSSGALVVGEALIDEVVDSGRVSRYPGGSPANVALGLGRLNISTRLHTAIGADADGSVIREHLAASGVTLTPESVTDAPTSRASATLAADGSATYEFALQWDPRRIDDLGAPTVIHAGSLGIFLEPGAEVTREILLRGRAAGALITLDPNVRSTILPSQRRAQELFESLVFRSDLTKLSDEDAAYLFPGKSLGYVLDLLIDGGVAVAAITRGSQGALLASGPHRVEIAPVTTRVADTVGAGDTFMATLIWALILESVGWNGQTIATSRLEQIGGIAARAAAITVGRPGADLPYRSELEPSNV